MATVFTMHNLVDGLAVEGIEVADGGFVVTLTDTDAGQLVGAVKVATFTEAHALAVGILDGAPVPSTMLL